MLLIGCAQNEPIPLEGIPDATFSPEPEFRGAIGTIGQLADGYAKNTSSLRRANNKLETLCVAALRCETPEDLED